MDSVVIEHEAANEEVVASNEELQSLNEELETDPATTTIQVEQANELISALSSATEPVILAGDFNANADLGPDHTAATVNLLAAGFVDAWRTAHPSQLGRLMVQGLEGGLAIP